MFFTHLKFHILLILLLTSQHAIAGESEDVETLRIVFTQGDLEIVGHLGGIFIKKYPASDNKPEVLFLMAHAESNFQIKKKYLENIKNEFGNTPWAAQTYLELGKIYLLKGDTSAAAREFAVINAKFKNSPLLGEALYFSALSNLANGAFHNSRLLFKETLSINEKFRVKSQIGIADTYFLSGDYRKSLSHYEDLLLLEMSDEHKAKVMHNQALSYTALGDNLNAISLFQNIMEQYPASLEVLGASEQLLSLKGSEEEEIENEGTYLQVGVYSTLASATAYEDGLKNMGLKSCILEGEVFKVLLGPFSDDIEAQIYAGKLKTEKGIDSFVFEK